MYVSDSITVLTPELMALHMPSASDKGITVKQKAIMYGPSILWTPVEGDPFSLFCTSPKSGKVYKVTLNPVTGEVRCSCPAKCDCYHCEAFREGFKAALMQFARQEAAALLAAVNAKKTFHNPLSDRLEKMFPQSGKSFTETHSASDFGA